ncbi:hypothetical protein yc1106_07751 [Curvularia clavata]|uniref:VWFA domain-containing protein n=1 Tax=Curvularia clavata TaxID=95742 RepID=A0A9Q8ZEE9_CURCL|nr:hypothetical protein yc1106_07751 [Curvularia clavata]
MQTASQYADLIAYELYHPFAQKRAKVSTLESENPATPLACATPPACLESSDNDPYAFLKTFDTIFIVDDGGSMAGRSWAEVGKALEDVIPICTTHDEDGIDVYFLNHRDSSSHYKDIASTETVAEIFKNVRPSGATSTGQKITSYLERYMNTPGFTKPPNVITIIDGEPTDNAEASIMAAAGKVEGLAWQVGIQFLQVDKGPRAAFKRLYDGLVKPTGHEKFLMNHFQKASSARYRAFSNPVLRDYDGPRMQLRRFNSATLAFLGVFALLPITQAATHHVSTTWGLPISNTLGIGTGLAISVFNNDETSAHPVLYWLVYGFWSLSALLVVAFTTFSIKKTSRLRYLCTFVLVEFLLVIMIAVSSMGHQGLVSKHLKEWMPLATLAIAGALTVGFKRVA